MRLAITSAIRFRGTTLVCIQWRGMLKRELADFFHVAGARALSSVVTEISKRAVKIRLIYLISLSGFGPKSTARSVRERWMAYSTVMVALAPDRSNEACLEVAAQPAKRLAARAIGMIGGDVFGEGLFAQ